MFDTLSFDINQLIQSKQNFVVFKPKASFEIYAITEAKLHLVDSLNQLDPARYFVLSPFSSHSKLKCCALSYVKLLDPKSLHDYVQTKLKNKYDCKNGCNSEDTTFKPHKLITQQDTKERYTQAFNAYKKALDDQNFSKLVLSRYQTEKLDNDLGSIFVKAIQKYPDAFVYLFYTDYSGLWFGASPEILCEIDKSLISTMSLAGTMKAQSDDNYTWSQKDITEQAIVTDYLNKTLEQIASLQSLKGPYTQKAGPVVHLRTDLNYKLIDSTKLADAIEALHPTPAVCGMPKREALSFIDEHELYNRLYYSGYLGLYDNKNNCAKLYVNLRSMYIYQELAYLFAGGGILTKSVLDLEFEETINKLNTLKSIL